MKEVVSKSKQFERSLRDAEIKAETKAKFHRYKQKLAYGR